MPKEKTKTMELFTEKLFQCLLKTFVLISGQREMCLIKSRIKDYMVRKCFPINIAHYVGDL